MYRSTTTQRLLAYMCAAALISSNALAVTESVTAHIAFDTTLGLNEEEAMDFGVVKAAQSGTYALSTGGVITPGGGGVWLSGTPTPADITISGSTTQTINISVGNAASDNGVSIGTFVCDYNGGGSGSCTINGAAAPGAGKTLLVGATATVDGSQAAGETAEPTFDVVAVYP